ncbi:unnamed protein product [Didymodactylos carnosus]|uniref:RBR-type E3 ubiquitin transferase n=1 Tax=Didymodactylos carnosus TaxID=1234261 RepID=A0A813U422_9BILA|nr:unnamed protein product [Didymodactylos carnosus]CAF0842483.1 unnamed protein product [Didymodactylos carnosus]CAF3609650.1 unnamed protein product [Didymodactylos carnosus]CAF3627448.1 unnamed protein product [Didymodactylos carnosus]
MMIVVDQSKPTIIPMQKEEDNENSTITTNITVKTRPRTSQKHYRIHPDSPSTTATTLIVNNDHNGRIIQQQPGEADQENKNYIKMTLNDNKSSKQTEEKKIKETEKPQHVQIDTTKLKKQSTINNKLQQQQSLHTVINMPDSSGSTTISEKIEKNHIDKIKSDNHNSDISLTNSVQLILSTSSSSSSSLPSRSSSQSAAPMISTKNLKPSSSYYPRKSIDLEIHNVQNEVHHTDNNDEILPSSNLFLRNFNMSAFRSPAPSSANQANRFLQALTGTVTSPLIHNETRSTDTSNVTDDNSTLSENECEICCTSLTNKNHEKLNSCSHVFCHNCLTKYMTDKIKNGIANLECPQNSCSENIHPEDIRRILQNDALYNRYELFMLRQVLQKMPDCRWCPYPDCTYAVLSENTRKPVKYECPVCNRLFCGRCGQIWHENQTCTDASAKRAALDPTLQMLMKSSATGGKVRPCPRCKSPIEKLDDGSCNHIRCSVCTCEFCWLCMNEVDNLHFITPTGCTFYGKSRWSKQKVFLFLILCWLLTPPITILVLLIAIPILLFTIPLMLTKKFYQHTVEINVNKPKRVFLSIIVLLLTFLITPLLLVLALLIGIPMLIFFIYFYMPRRFITANF